MVLWNCHKDMWICSWYLASILKGLKNSHLKCRRSFSYKFLMKCSKQKLGNNYLKNSLINYVTICEYSYGNKIWSLVGPVVSECENQMSMGHDQQKFIWPLHHLLYFFCFISSTRWKKRETCYPKKKKSNSNCLWPGQ